MAPFMTFSSSKSSRYAKMPRVAFKEFKYAKLDKATLHFHPSNKIGEKLYKGVLRVKLEDGAKRKIDVAIKDLSVFEGKSRRKWVREIKNLKEMEHPNLIQVIGYCAENKKKKHETNARRLVVYEFMKHGSVRDHLYVLVMCEPLGWETRLRIARDAARALAFLHVKLMMHYKKFDSSVILLDDQYNVKLTDYFLLRLAPSSKQTYAQFNCYFNDEIFGQPTEIFNLNLDDVEDDVRNFGIFLCELLTGRGPGVVNHRKSEEPYAEWVEQHSLSTERLKEIIDPGLKGRYVLESAEELATLAKMCLRRDSESHLSMKRVAAMMSAIA